MRVVIGALLLVASVAGAQPSHGRASDWAATWQRRDHPAQLVNIDVDAYSITATVAETADTDSRPVGSILFTGKLSCIGGAIDDPYCPTAEIEYHLKWTMADGQRCPKIRDGMRVRGIAQFVGDDTLVLHVPRFLVKYATCEVIQRGETSTSLRVVQ
jgi:hypothetical protein